MNRVMHYIPTIEELHVGFKYQMKQNFQDGTVKTQQQYDDAEWVPRTVGVDIVYIERALTGENAENGLCGIRAKYLDREDIESLDWKYVHHPNANTDRWYDVHKKGYLIMTSGGLDGKITITDDDMGTTLFKGVVKNKSRFSLLLEMMGI
tara:strand:+ start:552 stop:1001 length:450 start_codon:yes stop_codon:yes gene_type:complete